MRQIELVGGTRYVHRPGDPSPVVEQGSNGVINGGFAILDGPRTTTGVASVSAERDTGTCEVAVSGIR